MKVLGVDFDGTCVQHQYPDIGKDVSHCVSVLQRLPEKKVKIPLWTMRSDKDHSLAKAIKWFEDRGIQLWDCNKNPEQEYWTSFPKLYADVYIDDAALGCPLIFLPIGKPYVDWIFLLK